MRDKRYSIVKTLIHSRQIATFKDIFEYIPLRVVYEDLGVNYARFKKIVGNTEHFTILELDKLSGFFEMDPRELIEFAYCQYEAEKNRKKKK